MRLLSCNALNMRAKVKLWWKIEIFKYLKIFFLISGDEIE